MRARMTLEGLLRHAREEASMDLFSCQVYHLYNDKVGKFNVIGQFFSKCVLKCFGASFILKIVSVFLIYIWSDSFLIIRL